MNILSFPGGASGKEPACQCRRHKRHGLNPWVRKIPWRRAWQPTPVFLPGKSHGQRRLAGYSPVGQKELDMTERLHFYFSLSCTGEGNGNPHQCSCLENPKDSGAWWAAVYGVTQSRTRLKQFSSSSNQIPSPSTRFHPLVSEHATKLSVSGHESPKGHN